MQLHVHSVLATAHVLPCPEAREGSAGQCLRPAESLSNLLQAQHVLMLAEPHMPAFKRSVRYLSYFSTF